MHRQPHAAIDTRERIPCGPRRGQAEERIERPHRVDTLGHLLVLTVTPADRGDREQVAALAEQVQHVTGGTVEMAYVTGATPDRTPPNRSTAWPAAGSGQTPDGEERLCPAATTLGGRTKLPLGRGIQKTRQTTNGSTLRSETPPARLRHPNAKKFGQNSHVKFLTPSRDHLATGWGFLYLQEPLHPILNYRIPPHLLVRGHYLG